MFKCLVNFIEDSVNTREQIWQVCIGINKKNYLSLVTDLVLFGYVQFKKFIEKG